MPRLQLRVPNVSSVEPDDGQRFTLRKGAILEVAAAFGAWFDLRWGHGA